MIIVTTKMRVMPKNCLQCRFYLNKNVFGGEPECQQFFNRELVTRPSKGRQPWCPLLQTYQNKQVIDCRGET
jgi:hypothetical protein